MIILHVPKARSTFLIDDFPCALHYPVHQSLSSNSNLIVFCFLSHRNKSPLESGVNKDVIGLQPLSESCLAKGRRWSLLNLTFDLIPLRWHVLYMILLLGYFYLVGTETDRDRRRRQAASSKLIAQVLTQSTPPSTESHRIGWHNWKSRLPRCVRTFSGVFKNIFITVNSSTLSRFLSSGRTCHRSLLRKKGTKKKVKRKIPLWIVSSSSLVRPFKQENHLTIGEWRWDTVAINRLSPRGLWVMSSTF